MYSFPPITSVPSSQGEPLTVRHSSTTSKKKFIANLRRYCPNDLSQQLLSLFSWKRSSSRIKKDDSIELETKLLKQIAELKYNNQKMANTFNGIQQFIKGDEELASLFRECKEKTKEILFKYSKSFRKKGALWTIFLAICCPYIHFNLPLINKFLFSFPFVFDFVLLQVF